MTIPKKVVTWENRTKNLYSACCGQMAPIACYSLRHAQSVARNMVKDYGIPAFVLNYAGDLCYKADFNEKGNVGCSKYAKVA